MSQFKEKVKYIWPGEKPPMDTTVKTVRVSNLIISGLFFGLIAYCLTFFILWRDLPFMPIKMAEGKSILYYMYEFPLWMLGWISPLFEKTGRGFQYYALNLKESNAIIGFILRAIILFITTGIGIWYGIKTANVPFGGDKHVTGKVLLKAKEAYQNLKGEFDFMCKGGRGSRLVVAASVPFNPEKDSIDSLKPNTYIELPERLRRTHSMFVGGTGRGKSQLITYREVSQVHKKIASGEVVKLLICDTPKNEHSKAFSAKNVYKIAPHEEGGVSWNVAEDLTDALLAEAFWKGKIPQNDSDPIWANAAITVATGCTRYLQVIAPKMWNFGMLAQILTKSGKRLEVILSEHYPEARQILGAADTTLSSVMFNLGAYTQDLVSLARIYDGFEIKKAIYQSTAGALKSSKYVDFLFNEMVCDKREDGKDSPDSITKAVMFKGVCLYLNATNPQWNWADFAEVINQPKSIQSTLVTPYLTQADEAKIVEGIMFDGYWRILCEEIMAYADKWDEIEGVKKLSVKNWILNENPARKILILSPSEQYPTLTQGLIKGILYYSNSVILGSLPDDRKRKFHVIIDELQSYGNIEPFISPALALYRSKGVSLTLAFQDLAQLVKIYGQEFVDFMNSNIGNIVILGVNDGFTANKFTDLLGQKKIAKLHRTKTGDGSSSENLQEHEEKVIFANEWNLLGANETRMDITYLNLIAGLNPAYILTAPIIDYKVRNIPVKAKWITDGFDNVERNENFNLDISWCTSKGITKEKAIPKDAVITDYKDMSKNDTGQPIDKMLEEVK